MDIWTLLRITARRWYASVPILLIGLGLSVYLLDNVEPVYTAESTAILTPPTVYEGDEEGEIIEVNPFLDLGGSLNTTTEVMVVLMDSNAKRFAYEEQGLEPEYVVDRSDAVLYFEVVGPDAGDVVSTATELVRIADEEMAALQGEPDAPTEERVTVVPLSMPATAEEDALVGLRFTAVVAALAIGLAVVAAVLVDILARRRRASRTSETDESAPEAAPPARAEATPEHHAAESSESASMPSPRSGDDLEVVGPRPRHADGGPDEDELSESAQVVREPA